MSQQFTYPSPYHPQLPPFGGLPNQNVYMTPVQQRPDGLGNMVWSPYAPNNNNNNHQDIKPSTVSNLISRLENKEFEIVSLSKF